MRGMSQDVTPKPIDWSVLKTLFPYLLEFRTRIALAVACLVLAIEATAAPARSTTAFTGGMAQDSPAVVDMDLDEIG